MKFWEKLGWYMIALTVIVGVIFFATVIVFIASVGFGMGDELIAHRENDAWSVNINCYSDATVPGSTRVSVENRSSWWAREQEILWVCMTADSAKIAFLPMDSVKVTLWFRAQERNYPLSLLSETTVRDTFDLWNKNRSE